jgi:hypothetical protein
MIVVRFLLRFLLVPLAASVAVCVALVVIIVAHWQRFSALVAANPAPGDETIVLLLLAPALVLMAAAMAMLAPAALGALIAEAFAIRSWVFHVLNGGLSAAFGWLVLEEYRKQFEFYDQAIVVIGAGIAAGFAYWAIAGWNAGFWKPVFDSPQQAGYAPPVR